MQKACGDDNSAADKDSNLEQFQTNSADVQHCSTNLCSTSIDDGQTEFLARLGLNRKDDSRFGNRLKPMDVKLPVSPWQINVVPEDSAHPQTLSTVKRPGNGFILFSRERRKEVLRSFPNSDNRQVSKMLGVMWRKLTPDERKPYIDQFEAGIHAIRRDHPEWNYAKSRAKSERDAADKNTVVLDHRLRSRSRSTRVYYDSKQGFREGAATFAKQDRTGPSQLVISPHRKPVRSPVRPDPKDNGVLGCPKLDRTSFHKRIICRSQEPGQDAALRHCDPDSKGPEKTYQLSEVRVIQTDGKNQVVGIYKAVY